MAERAFRRRLTYQEPCGVCGARIDEECGWPIRGGPIPCMVMVACVACGAQLHGCYCPGRREKVAIGEYTHELCRK